MAKTLFACGTDNDGYPTCQGNGTTCGWEREAGREYCAELETDKE